MAVVIVRRCTSMRLKAGEFSGGPEVPCQGYMTSDGCIEDTCEEPCRWIMRKAGEGKPPWPHAPGS